ncbi:DUF2017 family protein [Calidifontibacter terrae]
MAVAFRRTGDDELTGGLDLNERTIVAELLSQTKTMIEPRERPDTGDEFMNLVAGLDDTYDAQEVAERDPVVRRILPDGHRDDPEAAAEFRAATEHGLREQKSARLQVALEVLLHAAPTDDDVRLTNAQAVDLMMALADTRLALGERLELRTDEDSDRLHEELQAMDPDGPVDQRLAIGLYYDFLTWLQESLAIALME